MGSRCRGGVFRQVKEKCIYLAALSPPPRSHMSNKNEQRERGWAGTCVEQEEIRRNFFGLPEGTKMGLHLLLLLLFVCMEEMERERETGWIQYNPVVFIIFHFFSFLPFSPRRNPIRLLVCGCIFL
jgi:hypothetical protein